MRKTLKTAFLCASFFSLGGSCLAQDLYPFQDTSLSIDERVDDLLSRMTLEEKVAQMMHFSPAIERLGIPAYNWWNEALHGVARSHEHTTVFPQPIGIAATFNPSSWKEAASMISDEARVVYDRSLKNGTNKECYTGLTFWTPNINIFRDPRWGRGMETYGEDPYLTSEMGMAIVEGLQGNHPLYLKSSACAKHFAVHSGPEPTRHRFQAVADEHDLYETYLPAFHRLITDGKVTGVMCAYNRFNGQPCCGSNLFLRKILLHDWKFNGYVTSDCGAINDFIDGHNTHPDSIAASTDAVLHGTDLECGGIYTSLVKGVQTGAITEQQLDISVRRLLRIRFRLGMYGTPQDFPYQHTPDSLLEAPSHGAKALDLARESVVLLKNEHKLLPLSSKYKKIALLGPNANNARTQWGNYNGIPSSTITLLDALRQEPDITVMYDSISNYIDYVEGVDTANFASKYKEADLLIYAGGLSPLLEGEAGDAGGIKGFEGGDRTSIALPEVQTQIMKKLKALGKPMVFICMSGSAISYNWEAEHTNAVLQAWYGGQSAGKALTDILFGRYNPSGKLPVTFYRSDADLPDINDYSMKHRTYKYFEGDVLYPFGYGLSYSNFKTTLKSCPATLAIGNTLTVEVEVRNVGKTAGNEVVQLYLSHRQIADYAPLCQLTKFQKVNLKPGEKRLLKFELTPREMAYVDGCGGYGIDPGELQISIGNVAPSAPERFTQRVVNQMIELTGKPLYFIE